MKTASAIKTKTQIENMRTACGISAKLHLLAMTANSQGLSELQLAKRLQQSFKKSEASEWAYPLIIGSGARANILHARPTSQKMKAGDLVLMDAGAKYNGIASDITRTWPVGHRFSKQQKVIYNLVLSVQKQIIQSVKPRTNLTALHQMGRELLLEGLRSAGVIKGKDITPYFPHKTSHWIGEHVHDPCAYFYQDQSPVELAPGMCFTVEPGLYLKEVTGAYQNIAVRIEDVILVTETGFEVLSHVPKEVDEIEELRSWQTK